jgi:peptide-methionine (S)-S-oxide reductase
MKFIPIIALHVFVAFSALVNASSEKVALATFGGGCFWCMEPPYDKLDGVLSTTSGFSGGHVKNPSYKQVVTSDTGHTEVVQVAYNPDKISYQELLAVYWKNIDPYDNGGQFCDRGWSYRPVIFAHNEEQARQAEASRAQLKLAAPVVVPVELFKVFYPAETYHQDYYQKNPIRYKFYRYNCGRDQRLNQVWGEPGH